MTTIQGISVRGARSRTESASGARRSATICSQAGGPSEMAAAAAPLPAAAQCPERRSERIRRATIAPWRRGQAAADRDPEADHQEGHQRAGEARRAGREVPRGELGKRDGQRVARQQDDQAGDRGDVDRKRRRCLRHHRGGESGEGGGDRLEEPRRARSALGEEGGESGHQADEAGDRDLAQRAAEKDRAGRRSEAPAEVGELASVAPRPRGERGDLRAGRGGEVLPSRTRSSNPSRSARRPRSIPAGFTRSRWVRWATPTPKEMKSEVGVEKNCAGTASRPATPASADSSCGAEKPASCRARPQLDEKDGCRVLGPDNFPVATSGSYPVRKTDLHEASLTAEMMSCTPACRRRSTSGSCRRRRAGWGCRRNPG